MPDTKLPAWTMEAARKVCTGTADVERVVRIVAEWERSQ